MLLLAKSDGTTLLDHTIHVVDAVKLMARHMVPCITDKQFRVAVHGAALHDLGKGHPHFQTKLRPGYDPERYDVPHRHEISSVLFLPIYASDEWVQLIDMVIAHHKSLKSLENDRHGRGLLDLVNDYGDDAVFLRHAEEWESWHPEVLKLLDAFDINRREIPLIEARRAFDTVVEHCENRRNGRSHWRGVLMAADHFASALVEETGTRSGTLFRPPDLTRFHNRADTADAVLYPLAKMSTDSPKPHTLLIAPTGAGKTDYLLRRCRNGRVFYLLPFQASINAMFLRLDHILNGTGQARVGADQRTDIRRVHAAAQIEIDAELEEETILQRHPGAAVKVMTPHQIAALVFGLAGHEAAALDVAGQEVILDEVHVYGEHAQAMVLEIVKCLVRLKCRVHIGSATVPSSLLSLLVECLGGKECVEIVKLPLSALLTYDRHVVRRVADENAARDFVESAVRAGKRILFVSNRVADSQSRYKWIRDTFPELPCLLVHSRYRRGDRAELERKISEFDNAKGPCIVCATQVIEVSLDISFDTMVTDCAPLDALVQRFGRINRRRVAAEDANLAEVAVIAPQDDERAAKPYSHDVLLRTWDALPDDDVLREKDIQALIDLVYPNVEITPIDVHLIETDEEFLLPELCHRPRSLLLDALEIDSACVIRESDLATYQKRPGERQKLEIPVTSVVLRPKFKTWRSLDFGHHPFVCPDEYYDESLGLMMNGHEEPTCIIL